MIRSADEFYRLRTSSDPEEYGRAAREPADEAVWLEVIECYPGMREWVAYNKSVPLSILRLLATSEDWRVRVMVAMKRKLDGATFCLLAGDPDAKVRHSITYNAKAPADVLERLCGDKEQFVAEAARERLSARVR